MDKTREAVAEFDLARFELFAIGLYIKDIPHKLLPSYLELTGAVRCWVGECRRAYQEGFRIDPEVTLYLTAAINRWIDSVRTQWNKAGEDVWKEAGYGRVI